jgi:hypothetical protein
VIGDWLIGDYVTCVEGKFSVKNIVFLHDTNAKALLRRVGRQEKGDWLICDYVIS